MQELTTESFQILLRSSHIIITDMGLSEIPCNRMGLMTLNSLKEIVDIEGKTFHLVYKLKFTHLKWEDQSTIGTSKLEKRSLQQFIDNLEEENGNVLRIVRMKSDRGFELNPFSSDYAAWRNTLQDPSSVLDDTSKQQILRWTDVSTKNSVQFWRLVPAGFGAFFDVRSGSLWIIIATSRAVEDDKDPDCFTRWDRYLEDFDRLKPTFAVRTCLESIRIEPGNRL